MYVGGSTGRVMAACSAVCGGVSPALSPALCRLCEGTSNKPFNSSITRKLVALDA